MAKGLALLGATGSIGRQTLDVVASMPGAFRVVALTGGRNVALLADQARRFRPALVAVSDAEAASALRSEVPAGTRVVHGRDGLFEAARHPEAATVVCALVGAAGVEPAYAAIDAGKDLALANKEALVAAGAFLTARANETGSAILPIDSEHNAIHQCLRGEDRAEIKALWLTASGGPFRTMDARALAGAGPEQALRHPTWVMGPKITIDSATLMNKGLEVIEAHWLFGLPGERIKVVVHPKSVVHSLVEMTDGSFKAQLGVTDMRHPIQYALTYPRRLPAALPPFDLLGAGPLAFEAPDLERFPCLPLAYEALARGGAAPAVLNAANEIAVEAFLAGRAGFFDIPDTVRAVLVALGDAPAGTLADLLDADRRARAAAAKLLDCGVKS
ncbi:MAG TPA: 1-deoxy-D-xylulose-5-phosphate reductoisomerase [Candidatus Polarisedimenticolaceae bacterium]|nr:1-deoxy-D-xylulose-5-phosphate reductoisomerase [Candidatus Polarisedimenticolaceae bacterium]